MNGPKTYKNYPLLPYALLFFLVLAVFINCLWGGFVFDDEHFIVKNLFLTSPAYLGDLLSKNIVAGAGMVSNLYRPMQSLCHFFDVQLWEYKAWGHHLTTVLIHCVMTLVFFRLLKERFSTWAAFLGVAFYSLHPMQAEAIAYIPGRCEPLGLIFISLGLLCYRESWWKSLLCFVLALTCKENMVIYPAYLLLFSWWDGPRVRWRRVTLLSLPAIIYVVLRLTILNFSNTLNFYNTQNIFTQNISYRIYTYLTTIPLGLRLWFWPNDLHHERSWSVFTQPFSLQVLLSALLVLLLIAWAIFNFRRSKAVFVGITLFFVATAPTSNIVVVINALFYDHWFLFPGVGMVVVITHYLDSSLQNYQKHQKYRYLIVPGLMGVYILAFLFITPYYNAVWRSPFTLYSQILKYEPKSSKAYSNLGMAYADIGDNKKARELYQKSIEINDNFPQTHHNLANLYLQEGNLSAAEQELKLALKIQPNFFQSWFLLGKIYFATKRSTLAKAAFQQAFNINPHLKEAQEFMQKIEVLE